MRYGDLPCCEWKPHTKYTLRWDLKPTPREETLVWYYTSGQKPMSGDHTGPKGEPTITMLLNEHSTICPLNSYLPNHKSRQLSNLIREAFVQWMMELTTGQGTESASGVHHKLGTCTTPYSPSPRFRDYHGRTEQKKSRKWRLEVPGVKRYLQNLPGPMCMGS